MAERPLSSRQRKFVELYDGNGTETARKAGYTGTDQVLGITAIRLLGKNRIAQAIRSRESKELQPQIAERLERQKFWTSVMFNPTVDMNYRLRASELLGKSEGDFLERVQVNAFDDIAERMKEAEERRAKTDGLFKTITTGEYMALKNGKQAPSPAANG